jgi:hypothetical protein
VNTAKGLVRGKTAASDLTASTAETVLRWFAYRIAVARGFIFQASAIEWTLTALRFS